MAEMNAPSDRPVRAWTLADVKAALVRRRWLAAVCFLALSAGAVAAVLMATPMYEGQLKILVKRDRSDSIVSGAAEAAADRSDLSEAELLSQVELIKADDLLEKVAVEAGLANRVMAAGDARTDAEALAKATAALSRDLKVSPIKKTWLIDVTYQADEPRLTRNVLDTLVGFYLEKHLTLHRPAGTYKFFSEQAELAHQELEAAQQRLAQFGQSNSVVSAATEKQAVLQKLSEFDGMRAQAAASLAETTQRLSAVTTELSRVPAQHTSQVRTTEGTGAMQDLQSRILTLEMKRTELLQRFTPEYRGVVEIDQQLRDAKAALADARSAPVREETIADNPTRQWLDTELARTQTDNAAIRARVQALSGAVAQYRARAQTLDLRDVEQNDLFRSLKVAEEKYRLYTEKREEARISDELDRTKIANVVIAQAPAVRYEPKRNPSLAMLPFLIGVALLLSLALAVAVDAFAPVGAAEPAPAPAVGDVAVDAPVRDILPAYAPAYASSTYVPAYATATSLPAYATASYVPACATAFAGVTEAAAHTDAMPDVPPVAPPPLERTTSVTRRRTWEETLEQLRELKASTARYAEACAEFRRRRTTLGGRLA